jgi:hypothetical protein
MGKCVFVVCLYLLGLVLVMKKTLILHSPLLQELEENDYQALKNTFEDDECRQKGTQDKSQKKGDKQGGLVKRFYPDWFLLRDIHIAAISAQAKIARKILFDVMRPANEWYFGSKTTTSVLGTLDAIFIKFSYAMLVNFVVIFLIVAMMNTISSGGLPGRQQLPEKTSFQVFLERFPVK